MKTFSGRAGLWLKLPIAPVAMSLAAAAQVLAAADSPAPASATLKWIDFPDPSLELRGLPWFKDNTPQLWRLPESAKGEVPKGAWNRAVAPDGGRIRFRSTTTRLELRVQTMQEHRKPCLFDAFVNGEYAGSATTVGTQRVDLVLFEKREPVEKDVTVYLPHGFEIRCFAVGVDSGADLKAPPPFALPRPMVCYGSSVLQGSGAKHPARTYPAAVARRLNLDFVNLGFGGAGKAEPQVVSLVNQLDACCYLFDLGKSYGPPTPERFSRMLDSIRASHPGVPIFCVTPIYSTKEANDPAYLKKSEDLRTLMRQAAMSRRDAGDKEMFVVEGLDLFGEKDKALFNDALHPNDDGNELMAERLAPVLKKALFGSSANGR